MFRVRFTRLARRIKQTNVASAIGVNKAVLCEIELGTRNATVEQRRRLSAFFSLPEDQLFERVTE